METLKTIKFIHILTIIIVSIVATFDYMLCFHEIPTTNKSIVDFIAGVLNGTCLGGAFAYWYHTTASSSEKNKQITDLIGNKSTDNTEKKG